MCVCVCVCVLGCIHSFENTSLSHACLPSTPLLQPLNQRALSSFTFKLQGCVLVWKDRNRGCVTLPARRMGIFFWSFTRKYCTTSAVYEPHRQRVNGNILKSIWNKCVDVSASYLLVDLCRCEPLQSSLDLGRARLSEGRVLVVFLSPQGAVLSLRGQTEAETRHTFCYNLRPPKISKKAELYCPTEITELPLKKNKSNFFEFSFRTMTDTWTCW